MDISIIQLGFVNCYLLKEKDACVLVDTGTKGSRKKLLSGLEKAGCSPSDIRLIVLTHGDIDHTGNCAYFKSEYGIKTAIHEGDAEVVRSGNMKSGRSEHPDRISPIFRFFMKFDKEDHFPIFEPDVLLRDGDSLEEYCINASIAHIPGHSAGSVAVTDGKNAICGDLLSYMRKPSLHFLIDDLKQAESSIAKLKAMGIETIYPGHGRPFKLADI